MNTTMPTSITVAEQCYRVLLRLYPAKHREEYGALMAQAFRDLCRDAYRSSGVIGLIELSAQILFDTLLTALQERKAIMLKVSWRWEIIVLLGGLCLLAFTAAQATMLVPVWERWRYETVRNLLSVLVFPAIVCLILTCAFLVRRYGDKMANWGRWMLGLSAVAGVVVLAVWTALIILQDNAPNGLWDFGMTALCVQLLSIGAFGIGNVRWQALPRGNFLAILVGLPFPLAMLARLILFNAPSQRADDSANIAYFVATLIMGAALGWLGLALMAKKKTVQP